MFASLAVAEGVGLAAPQIGVDLAVFVYDCPDDSGGRAVGHVVNPTIETSGDLNDSDEGCLSVPGPYHELPRYVQRDRARRGQDRRAGRGLRDRLPRPLPTARDRPPARRPLHRPSAAQPSPSGAARHGAVRVERARPLVTRDASRYAISQTDH